MMNGTTLIFIGIGLIGLGTYLTIFGQSKNNQQDTNRLIEHNKTAQKAIDSQSTQIGILQQEAVVLRNIGHLQLTATFYTEELNHTLRNVYFRIHLKEKVKFKELIPLNFAFEFNPWVEGDFRFRKFVENGGVQHVQNGIKTPLVSYKISDISFDNGSVTNSYTKASKADELEDIMIPVQLNESLESVKVKEFHDEYFSVYLPESLVEKTAFVELIVNGWGIFIADISNVFWRVEPSISWKVLESNEIKLQKPWSNNFRGARPPSSLWRINVYQGIPPQHKELGAREMPGSLSKGLIFHME